jgi:predicted RNase H-like HicB family nuclease
MTLNLNKNFNFPVVIEKDKEGGGYIAYCPILKGCHTYGTTIQEAEYHIKEALKLYLEVLHEEKERVVKGGNIYESINVALA